MKNARQDLLKATPVQLLRRRLSFPVTSELGFLGLAMFLGILFFAFRREYEKTGYVLFGSALALQLQAGERSPLQSKQEDPR